MNDNKKISQKLWAQNKYLVLSKSQKIYKDIRELLKKEDIAPDEVQLLIDQAIKLEENPKEVINSLQHIWGYFKNCAEKNAKENFLNMIELYKYGKINKKEILIYLLTLLKKYPNKYLENSNIFKEEEY